MPSRLDLLLVEINNEFRVAGTIGLIVAAETARVQSSIQRVVDCGPPVARSVLSGPWRDGEISRKSAVIQMMIIVGEILLTSRVDAMKLARSMS